MSIEESINILNSNSYIPHGCHLNMHNLISCMLIHTTFISLSNSYSQRSKLSSTQLSFTSPHGSQLQLKEDQSQLRSKHKTNIPPQSSLYPTQFKSKSRSIYLQHSLVTKLIQIQLFNFEHTFCYVIQTLVHILVLGIKLNQSNIQNSKFKIHFNLYLKSNSQFYLNFHSNLKFFHPHQIIYDPSHQSKLQYDLVIAMQLHVYL